MPKWVSSAGPHVSNQFCTNDAPHQAAVLIRPFGRAKDNLAVIHYETLVMTAIGDVQSKIKACLRGCL